MCTVSQPRQSPVNGGGDTKRASCPLLWDALCQATRSSAGAANSSHRGKPQKDFLLSLLQPGEDSQENQNQHSIQFVTVSSSPFDKSIKERLSKGSTMVLLPGGNWSGSVQTNPIPVNTNTAATTQGNSVVKPHRIIFDPSLLRMDIKSHHPLIGLLNPSNFCYLNSSIQALLNVPPLLNYLREYHSNPQTCPKSSGWCPMCALFKIMKQYPGGGSYCPRDFIHNVTKVSAALRPGRQEDAHEYILGMVSAMEDVELLGKEKLPAQVKNTNAIRSIFGFKVRTSTQCHVCHQVSHLVEPYLDLSLSLYDCYTLEECIRRLLTKEEMYGANQYHCDNCRQKRNARKWMTMDCAPPVLMLHLKRFECPRWGLTKKDDRGVRFSEALNLRPFLSQTQGPPEMYRLLGVMCHEGNTLRCGHYTAHIRRGNQWYTLDDDMVRQCSLSAVLNLKRAAYVLIYLRNTGTPTPPNITPAVSNQVLPRYQATPAAVATPRPSPGIVPPVSRPSFGNVLLSGSSEAQKSIPKIKIRPTMGPGKLLLPQGVRLGLQQPRPKLQPIIISKKGEECRIKTPNQQMNNPVFVSRTSPSVQPSCEQHRRLSPPVMHPHVDHRKSTNTAPLNSPPVPVHNNPLKRKVSVDRVLSPPLTNHNHHHQHHRGYDDQPHQCYHNQKQQLAPTRYTNGAGVGVHSGHGDTYSPKKRKRHEDARDSRSHDRESSTSSNSTTSSSTSGDYEWEEVKVDRPLSADHHTSQNKKKKKNKKNHRKRNRGKKSRH